MDAGEVRESTPETPLLAMVLGLKLRILRLNSRDSDLLSHF